MTIDTDCYKAIRHLKKTDAMLNQVIEEYQELSKIPLLPLRERRRKIERTVSILQDELRWLEDIYNTIHRQCYGFE